MVPKVTQEEMKTRLATPPQPYAYKAIVAHDHMTYQLHQLYRVFLGTTGAGQCYP